MLGPRATVLAYRAGATASRALPAPAVPAVAGAIGSALAAILPAQREVVARNLSRVVGTDAGSDEIDAVVRGAYKSYVHYWMESFRLPAVRPSRFAAHMGCEGWDNVQSGIAGGKGVILALPHLGSWDYAGAWMATIGFPMTVVVEPLDPPELFDWFVSLRRSLGLTVAPIGPGAAPAVLRALRANRVVGLLTDRDLAGKGIEVEFFGETTTLPAGPAALAVRSGAPLLPTAVYTMPRGQHLSVVLPPVPTRREASLRQDLARITQHLAHDLEALIRRAPEQWHLFQPNWPGDRPQGH